MLVIQIRSARRSCNVPPLSTRDKGGGELFHAAWGSLTVRSAIRILRFSIFSNLIFSIIFSTSCQSRLERSWRRPEHSKLLFIQVYRPRPTCFPFMFGPRPAKDTDSGSVDFFASAEIFWESSKRLSIEVGVVLHTLGTVQTIIYTSVYTHTNLFSIHVRSPARQRHSTDKKSRAFFWNLVFFNCWNCTISQLWSTVPFKIRP